MKFKFFLGVDVSKSTLDIAVRDESKVLFHTQIENSEVGLETLLKRLRNSGIDCKETLFCLEHTGIYSSILLHFLYRGSLSIWVQSAIEIKRSLGLQRGKNDKVDAMRIAEYAFRFNDRVRLWSPKRPIMEKIKRLTLIRERLIANKKQLKIMIDENKRFDEKSINKTTEKLMNPVIRKIEKQLEKVENEIEETIKSDEYINKLYQIVTSVPGVGPVTATKVIITTNEFKEITDPKKYSCYSGVVPFSYNSGTSIKGRNRVSHFANKEVKTLLHMAAVASISKGKGEMFEYYKRKVEQGKHKMSVLNAVRNKIIHRIFACVRDGRKYENFYTIALD